MQLIPALNKMGIERVFNECSADISGMFASGKQDLWVASVLHQTVVLVDEVGTKAAAATV